MARRVALTFDDGPSEWTAPILDALATADARATFFVLGEAVAGRESLLERAVGEGHELGVHGFGHRDLPALADAEIRDELERTRAILPGRPRLFRAPHLRVDERVLAIAAELGLSHVGGALVGDWEAGSAADVVAASLAALEREDVLVLHDGRPPRSHSRRGRQVTAAAVAALLPELAARGLEPVTVSELDAR